jgi:hypothetical protein
MTREDDPLKNSQQKDGVASPTPSRNDREAGRPAERPQREEKAIQESERLSRDLPGNPTTIYKPDPTQAEGDED